MEKGQTLGRFQIRDLLGTGGMAAVYLAYDPTFQREVAIKIMPAVLLHDQIFRERFTREARTFAALDHPAIVAVYEFGEHDGQPYLVMRLMKGGSLAQRIDNKPLALTQVAKINERLSSALDLAHEHGVIHRDLKPSNILFDQYDEVYLTDFGISRSLTNEQALTGANIIGTPGYMSPEQIQGETLDRRSDLYALGIVCYEMLAGKRAYRATTPAMTLVKQMTEPLPPLSQVRPDVPNEIQRLLARVTARERDARPTSAGEFARLFSLAITAGDVHGMATASGAEIDHAVGLPRKPDAETVPAPPEELALQPNWQVDPTVGDVQELTQNPPEATEVSPVMGTPSAPSMKDWQFEPTVLTPQETGPAVEASSDIESDSGPGDLPLVPDWQFEPTVLTPQAPDMIHPSSNEAETIADTLEPPGFHDLPATEVMSDVDPGQMPEVSVSSTEGGETIHPAKIKQAPSSRRSGLVFAIPLFVLALLAAVWIFGKMPIASAACRTGLDKGQRFVQIDSRYSQGPTIVDGSVSYPYEWSGTECTELHMRVGNDGPQTEWVRLWVKNDAEYLYVLVQAPADPKNAISIQGMFLNYYWPRYNDLTGWPHSDGNFVGVNGELSDSAGWSDVTMRFTPDNERVPPGTMDVSGGARQAGESVFIEFRKPLHSGDPNDWALEPGTTFGTDLSGDLLFGIWRPGSFLGRYLRISLSAP